MSEAQQKATTDIQKIEHFIDGDIMPADPQNPRWGDVYNPATGEVTGHVAMATPDDVKEAIRAASEAFRIPGW